jgi:hypothetical protein
VAKRYGRPVPSRWSLRKYGCMAQGSHFTVSGWARLRYRINFTVRWLYQSLVRRLAAQGTQPVSRACETYSDSPTSPFIGLPGQGSQRAQRQQVSRCVVECLDWQFKRKSLTGLLCLGVIETRGRLHKAVVTTTASPRARPSPGRQLGVDDPGPQCGDVVSTKAEAGECTGSICLHKHVGVCDKRP